MVLFVAGLLLRHDYLLKQLVVANTVLRHDCRIYKLRRLAIILSKQGGNQITRWGPYSMEM